MRRTTATTDYLKECMGTALLELMKEKPIEKISIEEMTAKADVGRSTYFRYFKSKDEVLSFKITLFSGNLRAQAGQIPWDELHHTGQDQGADSFRIQEVHAGPIAAPTGAADQQCGMAKRIQCVCSGYKQIIRSHCLQGLLQTGINISDFSPLIEQKMGALALRVGSFHPVFCNSSADTHRGVSQQRS